MNNAIDGKDFISFNILIEQLVNFQNNADSAIIVDGWLSEAIAKGLSLDSLFDSHILSKSINAEHFPELALSFPTHH